MALDLVVIPLSKNPTEYGVVGCRIYAEHVTQSADIRHTPTR